MNVLGKLPNQSRKLGPWLRYLVTFSHENLRNSLQGDIRVFEEVVSTKEEESIVRELDAIFARKRYATNHWDGVIESYKESERLSWADEENHKIVQKIQRFISGHVDFHFPGFLPTHAIDLSEEGFISPHIDSIKFSGGFVAGLSLLSHSVMKFQDERNSLNIIEAQLPPRSLYLMTGDVRYHYTHEILPQGGVAKLSTQKPLHQRGRRISLIFRDQKEE
mmetsp:Transcript_35068/g.55152  ORF Transcript_35068/g.55152 Transcript_35068/m.55152 type:complete len:220 (+) Transcript_35068:102-761(+)